MRPNLRPSAWLLTAIALACLAGPGHAFALRVSGPRLEGGQLWVNAEMSAPLDPRLRRSLERGMPATLQLHAELWRKRSAWFDRLEDSFDARLRLFYAITDGQYVLEQAGAIVTVTTLDSLEGALERPIALAVTASPTLQPGSRYYVVVTATYKPLSVEDLEEVDGWLSGEVRDQGPFGLGVLTALPRSLFDAVRNVAGFGDVRARAISVEFMPERR